MLALRSVPAPAWLGGGAWRAVATTRAAAASEPSERRMRRWREALARPTQPGDVGVRAGAAAAAARHARVRAAPAPARPGARVAVSGGDPGGESASGPAGERAGAASARQRLLAAPIDPAVLAFITEERLGKTSGGAAGAAAKSRLTGRARDLWSATLSFRAAAAAPNSFLADEGVPEVAFAGRSNVGKSSLINALCLRTRGAARVSDRPGETRTINWFRMRTARAAAPQLSLVDLPGYGFAFATEDAMLAWQNLIDTYVQGRDALKRVLLLIDARHGLKSNDREFLERLRSAVCRTQIVLTKCDTVPRAILARRVSLLHEELREYSFCMPLVHLVSSRTGAGLDPLRRELTGLSVRVNAAVRVGGSEVGGSASGSGSEAGESDGERRETVSRGRSAPRRGLADAGGLPVRAMRDDGVRGAGARRPVGGSRSASSRAEQADDRRRDRTRSSSPSPRGRASSLRGPASSRRELGARAHNGSRAGGRGRGERRP